MLKIGIRGASNQDGVGVGQCEEDARCSKSRSGSRSCFAIMEDRNHSGAVDAAYRGPPRGDCSTRDRDGG